jgi:hypothetical protein
MKRHYIPFAPRATVAVLLLILLAFTWAGNDETRLERSCKQWVSNANACNRF